MIVDTASLIAALSNYPGTRIAVMVNDQYVSIKGVFFDEQSRRVVIELDEFETMMSQADGPVGEIFKSATERRPHQPGS